MGIFTSQKWWITPRKIRDKGIMGMNQRNADYIMYYNPRKLYPLVDNKLITKTLASKNGISVPTLYGVIEIQHEIHELEKLLSEHQQFVIKPAHGCGGNGILVITSRMNLRFQKSDGELINIDSIEHHVSNILSGMYSLGGVPDKAIIEYCVQFDPFFEHIIYRGVPDIRIIVFRGVPVSAMIRLPLESLMGRQTSIREQWASE